MIKTLLLFVIFLFIQPDVSLAQSAFNQKFLNAAPATAEGYKRRKNDDRYEGIHTIKVAGEIIDIVSVTTGPVTYELSDKKSVILIAPKFSNRKEIGITGTSYKTAVLYHLDMLIKPGETKSVPMKTVLNPYDIYAKNFGVFGYLGDPDAPTLYVPVKAVGSDELDELYSKKSDILVTLLTNVRLENLEWSWAYCINDKCGKYESGQPILLSRSKVVPGEPINLPLRFNKPITAGSIICINVEGKIAGVNKGVNKSFKVLITD